jgi:hypothetical protein
MYASSVPTFQPSANHLRGLRSRARADSGTRAEPIMEPGVTDSHLAKRQDSLASFRNSTRPRPWLSGFKRQCSYCHERKRTGRHQLDGLYYRNLEGAGLHHAINIVSAMHWAGAIGTAADIFNSTSCYPEHENPASTATTTNIMVSKANAADLPTVYRGSFCTFTNSVQLRGLDSTARICRAWHRR